MALKRTAVLRLPEIDDKASIEILNPWLLPRPKPLAESLEGDALTNELRKRSVETLRLQVVTWTGVVDAEGHVIPPPKEWPKELKACMDLFDRLPQVVHAKLMQGVQAAELDHEWDPTKPPTAATPKSESGAAK